MENKETNVNRNKVREDGDVEKRIRQRSNDVRMMEIRDKSNMNRNVKTKMKQIT